MRTLLIGVPVIACSLLLSIPAFSDSHHVADGAAKGQATEGTVGPATTCPTGQTLISGKCVTPSSINYNASKSNTGNIAVKTTGNGVGGTAPNNATQPTTPK